MRPSCFARRRNRSDRRTHRLAIDALEPRLPLALDFLWIGGARAGSFIDGSGDEVLVSITGSAGTVTFRNSGGQPVENGDDIASIAINGASENFQLTIGVMPVIEPTAVKPLNGIDTVYLGRITADTVIRGVNTINSRGLIPGGGPTATDADTVTFSLESFEGVNFSTGGGLFVDVVTGDAENVGIELTGGFSAYSTIGIREVLDAEVLLGTNRGAKADGRLLIESATADSLIIVNHSGDTSANSKLEILGGNGLFAAGLGVRGAFAGTVNIPGTAFGSWVFEDDVAPSAVLKAANWDALTSDGVFPAGIVVLGDFAGTVTSTNFSGGSLPLTVGGSVKGTSRVNAAAALSIQAQGSVLKGAEFNAAGPVQVFTAGNFAGKVTTAENILAVIGGNLPGGSLNSGRNVALTVGPTGPTAVNLPTAGPTAVSGNVTRRNVVNASVTANGGLVLSVTGDVVKSSFTSGTGDIVLDSLVLGVPESPKGSAPITPAIPGPTGIGGSVRSSRFVSGQDIRGPIGDSVSSSVVQAWFDLSVDVAGSVSKSKFQVAQDSLSLSVGRDLTDSEIASNGSTNLGVGRDALRVRLTSEDALQQYAIGRNFQGSIQSGYGNVKLEAGRGPGGGSVLNDSSIATGGRARVDAAGDFSGVVDVDVLQFFVTGNVAKGSRLVATEVSDWTGAAGNFLVGGRFDGIVNVGFFDAGTDFIPVTLVGGGAGTSARFYVGTFDAGDTIIFGGDFRGNVRVLQDLVAELVFAGNLDRITIGGQVRSNIVVQGTLFYLNSNSWFQATGSGKRTGFFVDGQFVSTGNLTTGKYVTVVPLAPSVV